MSRSLSHDFYLVFSARKRGFGSLSVKAFERAPTVPPGAVSIRVSASLPEALFQRPQLKATIKVEPDQVVPTEIDAGVADNIVEIVKQQTGLDLNLVVSAPEVV